MWHDLLSLRQKINQLATRWRAVKADCSSGETSSTSQTSLTLNYLASGSFQRRGLPLGHSGIIVLEVLKEYDMQFNLTVDQSTVVQGSEGHSG